MWSLGEVVVAEGFVPDRFDCIVRMESVINIETSNFYVHVLKISELFTYFLYISRVKSVINMENSNFYNQGQHLVYIVVATSGWLMGVKFNHL